MHADFRALLEEEFAAGDSYRPNRADWLDGKWSGIGHAEEGARRGVTGVDVERLKEIGRKLTSFPKSFTPHKTIARIMAARRKMIEDGRRHRLGDRRIARLRHASHRGLSRAAVGSGQRARHLLAAPFGADGSGEREEIHATQAHLQDARRRSRSSTRCCRKRPCSASNMATASPSRTRSCCGRRSSAISPMARRWSSTSSSPRASANGCACPGS